MCVITHINTFKCSLVQVSVFCKCSQLLLSLFQVSVIPDCVLLHSQKRRTASRGEAGSWSYLPGCTAQGVPLSSAAAEDQLQLGSFSIPEAHTLWRVIGSLNESREALVVAAQSVVDQQGHYVALLGALLEPAALCLRAGRGARVRDDLFSD